MRHLLTAINASIAQQNWYAALNLTLALPDICGWLEDPSAPTQDRCRLLVRPFRRGELRELLS